MFDRLVSLTVQHTESAGPAGPTLRHAPLKIGTKILTNIPTQANGQLSAWGLAVILLVPLFFTPSRKNIQLYSVFSLSTLIKKKPLRDLWKSKTSG